MSNASRLNIRKRTPRKLSAGSREVPSALFTIPDLNYHVVTSFSVSAHFLIGAMARTWAVLRSGKDQIRVSILDSSARIRVEFFRSHSRMRSTNHPARRNWNETSRSLR